MILLSISSLSSMLQDSIPWYYLQNETLRWILFGIIGCYYWWYLQNKIRKNWINNQRRHKAKKTKTLPPPQLPPGRSGWPLIGETLAYVSNPDGFVKERVAKYGPVFRSHIFFRPTIFVGGPNAVKAFLKVESKCSTSSLPYTFRKLHGKESALNQSGNELKGTRRNIMKVLSFIRTQTAFEANEVSITTMKNVLRLEKRQEKEREIILPIMPFVRTYSLQLMSSLFLGLGEEEEEDSMPSDFPKLFESFNSGLLGILPFDVSFTAFGKGMEAKEEIISKIIQSMPETPKEGSFYAYLLNCDATTTTDHNNGQQKLSRETVAKMGLLFTWGAHYEVIALITTTLWLLAKHPTVLEKVHTEIKDVLGSSSDDNDNSYISFVQASELVYLDAVCKEVLRTNPPTGGGMRIMESTIEVQGMVFPKDYVITVDPRISGNCNIAFPNPDKFIPERFLTKTTKTIIPPYAFTPGGVGNHACPGISTGKLIAKIFVAQIVNNYRISLLTSTETKKDQQPSFSKLPFKLIDDDFKLKFTKRR